MDDLSTCFIPILVLPSFIDIAWQCYVQYIQLYPLSHSARLIRSTPLRWHMFTVGEQYCMVLCVAYNAFLLWSVCSKELAFSIVTPAHTEKGVRKILRYTSYVMLSALLLLGITLPFWWRSFAWGT